MPRLCIYLCIIALFAAVIGCNKDHTAKPAPVPAPTPTPVLSSNKNIDYFELMAVDNPNALVTTVYGVISNDTIYLTLPAQAPITALVPYIIFSGKSVYPASDSAANLSSSPTYTVTAQDGSTKTYHVIISYQSAIYVTDAGDLWCLDGNTGKVNWGYQTTSGLLSCPTTGNGLVYVSGTDGLYAVNAVNGSLAWKLSFGGASEPFNTLLPFNIMPVPILANGTIYGSFQDGTVRALDAKTGVVKWTFTTPYVFVDGPTLSNSSIYVGSVDGYVYSLDSATGNLNWKFQNNGYPFVENPLVLNNNVYIGSQGPYFYAIQASSGQLLWQTENYPENCSPAQSNGTIYMAAGNTVEAMDPTSGAADWWVDHGSGANGMSSVYLANGVAYVGSIDGYIYANNAANGNAVWSFGVGYQVYSSPVVANGRLYITDWFGHIIVLDATTGNSIWITNVANAASSICFIDSTGTVYHPAESGEYN